MQQDSLCCNALFTNPTRWSDLLLKDATGFPVLWCGIHLLSYYLWIKSHFNRYNGLILQEISTNSISLDLRTDDYLSPHFVEKTIPKCKMLHIKFACFLYILTNTFRHINLSYYGGVRWRMGCGGWGRGELALECVCVGMWTWQRHEMRKYTHQFYCLLEIVHHGSAWVVCF